MLSGLKYRFEQLEGSGKTDEIRNDHGQLPSWYLAGEVAADSRASWRMAAALERLGQSLLVPVQIFHEAETVEAVGAILTTEETIDASKHWLGRLTPYVINSDDSVQKMVGIELLSRLSTLAAIRDPIQLLKKSTLEQADHVGINAFEDALEPKILFVESEMWLDSASGNTVYLFQPPPNSG